MQEINPASEAEAAISLLFATVMGGGRSLNQSQIEQLSRMLVLSSRFRNEPLNELSANALSQHAVHGSKAMIEQSAPAVSPEFRETLFAMCCELVTADGAVDEAESELLALAALSLGLTVETMKMMLTTYLIRNRWNVRILDEN